jgi:hypothetical protein
MRSSDQPHDLSKHGETARAMILKRRETGIVFNGNPQLSLQLEVYPASRAPFQTEVKTVVARPHLPNLHEGALLQVSFDPDDPSRVVIAALPKLNNQEQQDPTLE